ncbi:10037_t:CDS:1, partial [Paraglomus brasilianum]
LGEVALVDHLLGMKALKSVLAPFLGMNADEYTQLAIDFESEVDFFQTYWISMRAFGMKPADKSVKADSEPKSEVVVESEKDIVASEREPVVKSESEDAE